MPEANEYYTRLLAAYLDNACTPQQVEELLQWLQQDGSNRLLLKAMQTEFNKAMETNAALPAAISDKLRTRLMQAIQPPAAGRYKRIFFRSAAAAMMLLAMGAAWFFLLKKEPVKEVTRVTPRAVPLPAAKNTGAFITLANGEQIALGNTGNGTVSGRDKIKIIKLSASRISYDTAINNKGEVTYHTLTVPRGIRMVQLILADGTQVWLNTASSIKYPTAFTGPERSVELTGEAYFDVQHNATKPFRVHTKNITVNVLGTGFNVSAYEDDPQTNVVLVRGSVALTAQGPAGILSKHLTPGNLASFPAGGDRIAVAAVNTDEYVSWKMGYLLFRQMPLEQIVKRISRYYDVQINTSVLAHSEETFSGRLDLQNNLEDIMNLMCLGTSYMYVPKEQKLAVRKQQ